MSEEKGEKKAASKREYVVLKKVEGAFVIQGFNEAASAIDAIRHRAKANGDGEYVAVAKSSWFERKVSTETQTRVVIR